MGYDYLKFQAHQLGGEARKVIVVPVCKAPFDDEVLPLYIAKLAHSLNECAV